MIVPRPGSARGDRDNVLDHSAVAAFHRQSQGAAVRTSRRQRRALATIAAICRQLDGIPLAIEFAAARAATLGLEEILARLDDRFALLTSGRRTALPRHRTLRATLDWSYELLSDAERVCCSLAIFAAAFSLEAASAVTRQRRGARGVIPDGIANLVAKSLVTADTAGAAVHFRLLDTTRAYALEKLTESGELHDSPGATPTIIEGCLEKIAGRPGDETGPPCRSRQCPRGPGMVLWRQRRCRNWHRTCRRRRAGFLGDVPAG